MSVAAATVIRSDPVKFDSVRVAYAYAGFGASGCPSGDLVALHAAHVVRAHRTAAALLRPGSRRRVLRTVTPSGFDAVSDAIRARPGVIFAAVHLGEFDLAGAWIAAALRARPLIAVSSHPSVLRQRLADAVRHSSGLDARPARRVRRDDFVEQLLDGRPVIIMVDRRARRSPAAGTWLDRAAALPTAPWRLSAATGAPIVPVATWTAGAQRTIAFGAPTYASDGECTAITREISHTVDGWVRHRPHQWHVPTDLDELPWLATGEELLAESARPRQR